MVRSVISLSQAFVPNVLKWPQIQIQIQFNDFFILWRFDDWKKNKQSKLLENAFWSALVDCFETLFYSVYETYESLVKHLTKMYWPSSYKQQFPLNQLMSTILRLLQAGMWRIRELALKVKIKMLETLFTLIIISCYRWWEQSDFNHCYGLDQRDMCDWDDIHAVVKEQTNKIWLPSANTNKTWLIPEGTSFIWS